jgi:nitroreductase
LRRGFDRGVSEIVRAQLAIPAELSILCGLAVGYPVPDFPANKLRIGREAIENNVVFLDLLAVPRPGQKNDR